MNTPQNRRPRGDGTLFFRSDKNLWTAAFDLGRDSIGKRIRRTLYARTRIELRRKIADLKARGGGSIRPRAQGGVGDMVERWLEDDVKPNRSRNTYALYESMWRVHARPLIGALQLERFDAESVSALYRRLRERGAMPSVIHRVGVVLHRAFEVAIRRQTYRHANPFSLVDRPSYRPKSARSLTADEARRFIESARLDRFEALWILCVTAGLRLGEVLGLKWTDVDFERRTVSINRSLVEVGGHIELGPTKTPGSRRMIDLGDLAMNALLRRLSAHDGEGHGSALLFSTLSGVAMRRSYLRRWHFTPLLNRANIPHIRIHDLRHTMTSLALAEGINVNVLAERLGHSSPRLTQERYVHVMPGQQRGAADVIDLLLRQPPSSQVQ